ncbi:hypothetical protein HY480_00845 [Candidatus Uhrbacteria bacterium]|nr:hypothetical protein [Candidatus Uhrbacteria bacterium]
MAIAKKILNALGKHQVKYRVLPHKTVYTAYDLATTLGEELGKVAKTLLVRADRRYVLVVLPASVRLDLPKLAKLLKAKAVSIAPEAAIKKLKLTPGTTPPFGSLVGLEVALEKGLTTAGDIIVRAGSLTESLGMKVKDFVKMEQPILGAFGVKGKIPKSAKKQVASRKRAASTSKRKARR